MSNVRAQREIMTVKNRYAPPTTAVADSQQIPLLQARPKQVRVAVALLWASLALGIPEWILSAIRDPENTLGVFIVGFTMLLFAFSALLNIMIYRGRNWARIVALVLTLLGVLFAFVLVLLVEPKPPSQLENALTLLGLVLDFIAVYLVFTKPGSLWFKVQT
jgi:peptidoglycan/LPS O-acetylase OafA/YrhL